MGTARDSVLTEPPSNLLDILTVAIENMKEVLRVFPTRVRLISSLADLMLDLHGASTNGRVGVTHSDSAFWSLTLSGRHFFLAAVQHALACQSFAVPLTIRAALESIGYAALAVRSPDAAKAWHERHKDVFVEFQEGDPTALSSRLHAKGAKGSTKAASVSAFRTPNWMNAVKESLSTTPNGEALFEHFEDFYEQTIDLGAHPNFGVTLPGSEWRVVPEDGSLEWIRGMFHPVQEDIASDLVWLLSVGVVLVRIIITLDPNAATSADAAVRLSAIMEAAKSLNETEPVLPSASP